MTKSMRSKSLIFTCALLSVVALGACDAKSTDTTSFASEPADVASADSESAEKTTPQKDEAQKQAARPSATSPNGAEVSHEPPLDIAELLKAEDLGALSAAEISTGKLAGKAATPTYNSTRFYPKGGALYGVGLQVWKFEKDSEAVDFVLQMRSQHLGIEDAPADAPTRGARAFISSRAGIIIYDFAPESSANYVLAISCGVDFCKNGWADLKPLATTVQMRVLGDKKQPAPKKDVKKDTKKAAKK